MKILFLDTASKENTLALCTEKETIVLTHLTQKGDAELIQEIEDALAKTKWTYKDLTHLACAIGPGGFTSLRVGVTAINTLAFTLDIPSTGIHLSDLWHARVTAAEDEPVLSLPKGDLPLQSFLWLHSTRRTQLFIKGFGCDGTTTPATILDLEEAKELDGMYVGELIDEHKEALSNCHPVPENHVLPLEDILPKFLSKKPYANKQLLPWYGRKG